MKYSHDAEYYRSRAATERSLAAKCADKTVARIHLDMAERYTDLAREVADGSPISERPLVSVAQAR